MKQSFTWSAILPQLLKYKKPYFINGAAFTHALQQDEPQPDTL
jgi:hypothetical protein